MQDHMQVQTWLENEGRELEAGRLVKHWVFEWIVLDKRYSVRV